MPDSAPYRHTDAPAGTADVLVVGTGFSGLCMAIKLQQAGNRDVLLLEEAQEVGGTWRDNHYPGCACDIPSHLYSLSFAPKSDWTRMYPSQPEIFAYMRDVADRFGLRDRIRFGARVERAAWDEARGLWVVHTLDGRRFEGRALAAGMGGLHVPLIPEIPGADTFAGPRFHSAAWQHGVDLAGRRVAVIGSGASAIQFVPEIAPLAARLAVFQRTPPWVLPRPDFAFSPTQQRLLRIPALRVLFRNWIYLTQEIRAVGFLGNTGFAKAAERMALNHLARQVADPALRAKLTPTYTLGCKRVLISNDWYPAIARPNVDLVAERIAEIRADAVVTADGVAHPADVIIYGTGFHTTDAFASLDVTGRGGITLKQAFAGGMHAFYGVTVPDFPNFFLMMGPNTGLGHNSMVVMIEAQVRYIMSLLGQMRVRGWRAAAVRADIEAAYNRALQDRLAQTVWQTGGCRSWYQDESGRNTTLWPGFTLEYVYRTRQADLRVYDRVI